MIGRVFDFIFPLECIACGASGSHCCESCLSSVPMLPRFWKEPELRASAAFAYGHPLVRRLLHDLKFEQWSCAERPLEVLVRQWCVKIGSGWCPPGTIVLPVPLHATRLRERGFNQAMMLANIVASSLGVPCREAWLTRSLRTKPQTDVENRAKNVATAFQARLPASAKGRSILLVDDVWTTGATMRSCAKTLRAAGAGSVQGFALAWGRGELHKQLK
ncbi:MAG: phosphoribosyltransferase family protein [Patescibacteria group bacterium]|jgi:ComF family protein